jgi:phosphoribosyl-ATP pyrophosphohydrolase
MTLAELFSIYKEYAELQGLKPYRHRTHLLLIINRLSRLLLSVSNSGDRITDSVVRNIASVCDLFTETDKIAEQHYTDSSEFLNIKEEEKATRLFVNELTDIIIHLCIYIGGNDLDREVLLKLQDKVIADRAVSTNIEGRFVTNRTKWS